MYSALKISAMSGFRHCNTALRGGAYSITLILGWLGILGAFLFTEAGRTPVIFAFAVPLFIGLVIYENSNKEYEQFLKEQLGKSPDVKKYFLLKTFRRMVAVTTGVAITSYFGGPSTHHDMKSAWIYGTVMGIIFGITGYFRLTQKDEW
jgi:hypothetical protein